MHCSGCGKDVPFAGKVCPHCQRDKSGDQVMQMVVVFFFFLGGGIGYLVSHFVIGLAVGGIIGIAVGIAMPKQSVAPEVRLSNPKLSQSLSSQIPSTDIGARLAHLDTLKSEGFISEVEYAQKRQSILSLCK